MKRAVRTTLHFLIVAAVWCNVSIRELDDIGQLPALMKDPMQFHLITFYSPMCGHCIRFLKILAIIAPKLPAARKPLVFINVNSFKFPQVIEQFNIEFFPFPMLCSDGKIIAKMDSMDTSQEFLATNWIKRNTGMPGVVAGFAQKTQGELIYEAREEALLDRLEFEGARQEMRVKSAVDLAKLLFREIYDDSQKNRREDNLYDAFFEK